MHYYQHNIGDYARDTGHLTVLEHGIYRLLLDWCYLNEKPITTEQAIRVGRGNPVETQSVISEFFSLSDDGWVHKRVAQEVSDYHKKAVKNRVNGAKGGRPKPNNNPVGSQTDAKHNPNQEPITINQEPLLNQIHTSPDKLATCPTEKVIVLYNNTLPELPSVRIVTEKRKRSIGKFWQFVLTSKKSDGTHRAENSEQALEWIESYFMRVRENDFLMGKTGRTGDHSNWQCDIDYLMTDKGITQVIEKTRDTK
ncbi:Protein of unknown function DUF1376 [uncultured Caudovirales phage]|uniref:DUF1376 domain-containing protein n=1 Tax=uncultured Caudovirales phage TaxID=2100421 RepID=A0A6J5L6J5_9CAUD|nr:Protein of unknown function DUF1376 [uncultured Caudovirales phage]